MAADMSFRVAKHFSTCLAYLSRGVRQQRNLGKALISTQASYSRRFNETYRLGVLHKRLYSTKPNPQIQELPQPAIYTAICVERLPVVTADKSELEKRFEKLQDQLEIEHSVLCDDELTVKKLRDRKKKLTERDEDEAIEIAQIEANRKEFQEEEEEELLQFQPASRETDDEGDVRSMNRKLQHNLVLLLKRNDTSWEMPIGQIQDKESLRQAAERSLKEMCGDGMDTRFLSNAPAAVLKMSKLQPKNKNKVFFYKVHFLGGSLNLGETYTDFAWLTRDEIQEYLVPEYYRLVRRFLH
ncbi:39S ribosomal protein L46, mitochondrial [Nematostella vectensis]|uniref:39S ribosomal protein L46, mitochondrial n=1 Tax=Nematostella vectensis TaxID=45351 RepID=UPI00207759CB|nr:39S ribosomal protein L46, mitochondrial [Nematostella vectensis]